MQGHMARRTIRGPAACLKDALGRYDIPSFPRVGREVLALLQDPDVGFRRVVTCLERDPGLVAQIMRTVNSVGFGPARAIKSLDTAVSMLGLRTLESMVVTASVPALLNTRGPTLTKARMATFWTSSATRGFLARAVAESTQPEAAAASYVAALLQDMALPFLLEHRGDVYWPLLQAWSAREVIDLAAEERDMFGWDHQQVAGWMCAVWSLPYELNQAISNHHEPDNGLPAVYVASHLVEGRPPNSPELVAALEEAIGPQPEKIQQLIGTATERAEQLTASLVNAKLPKPPRRLRSMSR